MAVIKGIIKKTGGDKNMANPIPAVEERQVISAMENTAKNQISQLVTKKDKIKGLRTELEDKLKENASYENLGNSIKEYQKEKLKLKEEIIEARQELRELNQEIKDLTFEAKETQLSLFDNLLELNQKMGKTEIVDNAGVTRYIVVGASIKI